jgi:hypothetical protein
MDYNSKEDVDGHDMFVWLVFGSIILFDVLVGVAGLAIGYFFF